MKTTAEDVISQTGFIMFFLLLCLVIGMFFGDNILYWFLLLVLFSMIILNADKFAKIFTLIN